MNVFISVKNLVTKLVLISYYFKDIQGSNPPISHYNYRIIKKKKIYVFFHAIYLNACFDYGSNLVISLNNMDSSQNTSAY